MKLVKRTMRYTFNPEERQAMGEDLARAFSDQRSVQAEFDQVKASYKSKEATCDASICRLSTDLVNGFDMRPTELEMEFDHARKKRMFYRPDDATGVCVLEEDMTAEDFQEKLPI